MEWINRKVYKNKIEMVIWKRVRKKRNFRIFRRKKKRFGFKIIKRNIWDRIKSENRNSGIFIERKIIRNKRENIRRENYIKKKWIKWRFKVFRFNLRIGIIRIKKKIGITLDIGK
jgi:hypothetical protein